MNAEKARPTVVFFPWVTIETSVTPSGIELRPYHGDDPSWSADVRHILNAYEGCVGQRIKSATIVAYDGKVGDEVSEAHIDATFAFREALSFAALRQRAFFSGSGYCNDHTFHCVAQAYVRGSPGATAVSRRRDGRSMTYLGEELHRVICPHYVSPESQPAMNGILLRGLLDAMGDPACDWVSDGIELFNMANTDSPQMRSHNEVLLTVAAAQRLLGVTEKSDAKLLSRHFADILYGTADSIVDVKDCGRLKHGKAKSIAQGWFYDLYADRGPVAHGRPKEVSSRLWRREEHLLLAAYIIPRIALVRLASAGHYSLTEHDRRELEAFELLLCLNNVFGTAEEGVTTGLPPKFRPVDGRYAWNEALRLSERERFMQNFFRENNIDENESDHPTHGSRDREI